MYQTELTYQRKTKVSKNPKKAKNGATIKLSFTSRTKAKKWIRNQQPKQVLSLVSDRPEPTEKVKK